MDQYIEDHLRQHDINYILHKHPAVFTCEEAAIHCKNVPGMACKVLFLKGKKNGRFLLVLMPAEKRLQIKELSKITEARELTFVKEEEMQSILGLHPGSVSPLGILNDKKGKAEVIIDQNLWDAEIVSFHPNINTESLEFKREDFRKLMESFPAKPFIIKL